MKLVKSVLYASAAAVISAGAAQAADLPSRKAAPVAYVKICDVYGRGFYYIPGTNTCLRVGGRVRVEYGYYQAKNFYANGAVALGRRLDTIGWRARGYINMDSRTQTAWGTVQAVFSLAIRSRSGIFNAGAVTTAAGGRNTATTQVYAAYIRFAGFTFGRAKHNHVFMPGYYYNTMYTPNGSAGVLQLAYTATFGGGFSATIALEDLNDYASMRSARRVAFTGAAPGGTNHPNRLPVLVGNVHVDQGWGSLMLAGAVGQWRGDVVNGAGVLQSLKRVGYYVGGGVRINLPMLARGDRLDIGASFATGGLVDMASPAGWLNGDTGQDRRIAFGYTQSLHGVNTYFCTLANTRVCSENNRVWTVGAIFTHYWTPTLRSHVRGSYINYRTGRRSSNTLWTLGAVGGQRGGSAWEIAHLLVWRPARGFDIGVEVQYRKVNNRLAGFVPPPFIPANTGGIRVKRNPGYFAGKLRIQKTW